MLNPCNLEQNKGNCIEVKGLVYAMSVSPATTIRTVSSMLSLHKYKGFWPLIDSTAEVV